MKEKELPGWLETLYNTNPGLAERAEKYIDTVWNEAIEAAAKSASLIEIGYVPEDTDSVCKDMGDVYGIDKQSILKLKR